MTQELVLRPKAGSEWVWKHQGYENRVKVLETVRDEHGGWIVKLYDPLMGTVSASLDYFRAVVKMPAKSVVVIEQIEKKDAQSAK